MPMVQDAPTNTAHMQGQVQNNFSSLLAAPESASQSRTISAVMPMGANVCHAASGQAPMAQ